MHQGACSGGACATRSTDPRLITMDGKAQADQLIEDPPQIRLCRGLLRFVAYFLVAAHLARAACRARRESRVDLAFVLAASAVLALLLYCVGRFEALVDAGESRWPTRERLRVCVWALSMALTVMFSARVAAMVPRPLDLLVVAIALAVTVGGFCLLFLCSDAGHGDGDWDSGGLLETCDGRASEQEEKV